MKWEDIKAKLLSRKFWLMVMTFIGLILVAFSVDSFTTEKIIGVIASFSILAVYIVGETVTDIANRKLTAGEIVVVSVAQKLSSRKFWAALISFITTLMITLGVDMLTIDQVKAMITAIATVAIYILGESAIDASKITAELNAAIKDVEKETQDIIDSVTDTVLPAVSMGWTPMYVAAPNELFVNVYSEPLADKVIKTIPHQANIYVEPGKVYGEGENLFYKFITNDSDLEYYILIADCIDA